MNDSQCLLGPRLPFSIHDDGVRDLGETVLPWGIVQHLNESPMSTPRPDPGRRKLCSHPTQSQGRIRKGICLRDVGGLFLRVSLCTFSLFLGARLMPSGGKLQINKTRRKNVSCWLMTSLRGHKAKVTSTGGCAPDFDLIHFPPTTRVRIIRSV